MTFRKRGTTTITIQASMLPITMNINSFQKARCSVKCGISIPADSDKNLNSYFIRSLPHVMDCNNYSYNPKEAEMCTVTA